MIDSGIDVLRNNPKLAHTWGRVALVANQASIAQDYTPSWKILQNILGKNLVALFGPQHGFESTVQDNMIESGHSLHQSSQLPVYSLYSETREPTEKMLGNIDTMIIDLQVVGTRIYTYKSTLLHCMRAAKKFKKKIVVLDRLNPLGGKIAEGHVLDEDMISFVGCDLIPMRHALTMGEVGKFFNRNIHVDYEVIPLKNWNPNHVLLQGEHPWVITSPNLATLDMVYIYPGMVMMEGTNLSEGRGTVLPFLFCGAPYIKNSHQWIQRILELLPKENRNGFHLRPASFLPGFQKWQNQLCEGFQIHILEPEKIKSFALGLATMRASLEMYPKEFAWKQPPYEYEFHKTPVEVIFGSKDFCKKISVSNFNLEDDFWNEGVENFQKDISKYWIYERG